MATKAQGSQAQLIYITEATWGTTPASPSCTQIDFTDESLDLARDSLLSNMIRNDRNINYHLYGNKAVSGAINAELIYNMFDDFLASAFYGAWATDVLKNGTTQKAFSIEKGFTDISQYLAYTGMVCASWNITCAPNSLVTHTFNWSGQTESSSATSIDAAASYDGSNGSDPFDSFTGSINEGGSGSNVITSFDVTLDNQHSNEGYAIGTDEKVDIFEDRCNVTGTISAYFEDLTLYNKFLNGTESSLTVTFTDPDGNSYILSLPRIKYTGETPKIGGGGPIIPNMPFQALYDSSEACTIKLTRSAA